MLVVARLVCAVDLGLLLIRRLLMYSQRHQYSVIHDKRAAKVGESLLLIQQKLILVDSCACPTSHSSLLGAWHHSCLFPREPIVTH
jgi:hypothetical protein